jgi:hypothetical protein
MDTEVELNSAGTTGMFPLALFFRFVNKKGNEHTTIYRLFTSQLVGDLQLIASGVILFAPLMFTIGILAALVNTDWPKFPLATSDWQMTFAEWYLFLLAAVGLTFSALVKSLVFLGPGLAVCGAVLAWVY